MTRQISSFLQQFLLILLALIASVFAQSDSSTIAYSRDITPQVGIIGALLIAGGLLFLFFGFKLYKIVVFLAGVLIGSILCFIILTNVEPSTGFQNRETVYLCGCLAVGVIVGFLFVFFVKLGLIGVGAWGGFSLAVFILSWKSGGTIQGSTGQIIFIILCVMLGAVLVLFFQKSIMITSTSFGGAFMIDYGVDMFVQKGFTDGVRLFLSSTNKVNTVQYEFTDAYYGYLISIIVLFILGVFVQYRSTRGSSRI